jgi:hypothetical protein
MSNPVFEIEITSAAGAAVQLLPAYSCGHCSATVILRPDRQRERVTCRKCGRWLCEQNELCHTDCTPLYDLVADRNWMESTQWTRLLPAIMGGASTVEDATQRGLLKE